MSADPASEAADALHRLAEELRADEVIAEHVRDADEPPALGMLAAAGPRAAEAPGDYVLLFEAIREGYLLHFGEPRLIVGADPDLRLLAGDYLYALGLERLAEMGDMDAVRELGDLISLSAQLHARQGDAAAANPAIEALWLASAVAVGAGATEAHEAAKQASREGSEDAERELIGAAQSGATSRMRGEMAAAAESIGFASEHLSDRG
jgi:hypothetical protein